MTKIIEEAMTNIIRRIELLEFWKQSQENMVYPPSKQGPNSQKTGRIPGVRYASDGQIKYLISLGGQSWEGITHDEISPMIDELKKPKSPKVTNHSESPEIEAAIKQGTEDIKNAMLSEKEIKKLEDEGGLLWE